MSKHLEGPLLSFDLCVPLYPMHRHMDNCSCTGNDFVPITRIWRGNLFKDLYFAPGVREYSCNATYPKYISVSPYLLNLPKKIKHRTAHAYGYLASVTNIVREHYYKRVFHPIRSLFQNIFCVGHFGLSILSWTFVCSIYRLDHRYHQLLHHH